MSATAAPWPWVTRPSGLWRVAWAAEKLQARGALPGAFGYDLAAHAFRVARARGVAPRELLPAALPTSWMVNARASSPVFRRWLRPPLRGFWEELLEVTAGGPEAWLARGDADRQVAERAAMALGVDGQGVAAVTKVLALLAPESAMLMDDAAIWYARDAVACPATADAPTAGAPHLVPTLDWFCRAALAAEPALVALARGYALAPLDAPQVLDRLIWFESWGYRHSHAGAPDAVRWWWVADDAREGIVPVPGPHPARRPEERVDLASVADETWREHARAALDPGA